jgi:hypothetical protein
MMIKIIMIRLDYLFLTEYIMKTIEWLVEGGLLIMIDLILHMIKVRNI